VCQTVHVVAEEETEYVETLVWAVVLWMVHLWVVPLLAVPLLEVPSWEALVVLLMDMVMVMVMEE
jgi:hypothetical protein